MALSKDWSHRVGGGWAPLQKAFAAINGPNGPTLPTPGHRDVVEGLNPFLGTRSLAFMGNK